jgi:hypothetical protein
MRRGRKDDDLTDSPELAAEPSPAGEAADGEARVAGKASTMIPARTDRSPAESVFMRLIATAGIIGIAVAIAAILASQHVQGWITGLAVSIWSVVLAAILWSSRRL